ncbi:MAG: 3-dehydroquinate synthase [Dermatophilaceae bacterium]
MTAPPERIAVGDGYDVLVGRDLRDALVPMLGDRVATAMVVHSASVRALAERLADEVRESGRTAYLHEVPDGEAAKTATVAAAAWAALGQADVTRSDAVVGVGGGAVTDLAGFVAATWLRGIRVVQVPTTLLAMVDAAVGGKTGINTAEGKNLVGAFHPPAGVLCDLDLLRSLPKADYVAGLAEVVKTGFVGDPTILDLVEADPEGVTDPGHPSVAQLVARSVSVKARVVAADLRESGPRESLNYGHTFAHAIEAVEGYTWRHGEAVSVGLVYAARLGQLVGRTDPALAARHATVLVSLGLPVSYRGDRWPALLRVMRRDKKARGSLLRFVVLDALARPGRLEGPDDGLLQAAYRDVSQTSDGSLSRPR